MTIQPIKIAAISDIHSNIFALNAVLTDIETQNVDVIVNLGDILYGPIAPKATYDRLCVLQAQRPNTITIRGNQDRQIYEADSKEIAENSTMKFIMDDLPIDAIKWMQNLPFEHHLTENVYLCHGSPTDDMIYLLEEVESGAPTIRPDKEILQLLNGNLAQVIVCGHTHIPRTVKLSTGQIVVNTGSVGYPAYEDDLPVSHKMETYSPHASYAIIELKLINDISSWKVSHIKVPYDHASAAKLALRNGRKDWEYALMTGRVGG
ncbi:metallophosphoesterase family protein [Psychrobacter lutiphocae]|uniref:metallophosphoesterase family protein n=1 Tax=Psychrobacter lutiphocae TaxID=540500 RepID=UPI00037E0691|nr:metallophosphoesterase family protein [Psychrobacter lutiphocae]